MIKEISLIGVPEQIRRGDCYSIFLSILCIFAIWIALASTSYARCIQNNPLSGDTVTCTDTDSLGISGPDATNVVVNIEGGATITSSSRPHAIELLDGAVINSGTIKQGSPGQSVISLGSGSVLNEVSGLILTQALNMTAIQFTTTTNSTVINKGTIIGDIKLGSGDGTYQLQDSATQAGNVDGEGGLDVFRLAGVSLNTFNVSSIVNTCSSTNQFCGFDQFEKSESGIWVLSGAGAQDWIVSQGVLQGDTFSMGGNLTNSAWVVFDQSTNGTYNSVISGAGSVIKTGMGMVTLTSSNNYLGATMICNGILQLGGSGILSDFTIVNIATNGVFDLNGFNESIGSLTSSGAVTLGTAVLTVGGTNLSSTFSGTITGSGGLTKVGTGVFTVDGSVSYTGDTVIEGGALRLGVSELFPNANSVIVMSDGQLDLNGFSETIDSLTGSGQVTLGSANLTIGVNNSSSTFSGQIIGSGSVTKQGSGTFTLGGANTYSGMTRIEQGELQLGIANALADSTTVHVESGAVFDLNNFDNTIGSLAGNGNVVLGAGTLGVGADNTSTIYAGVISGTGSLSKVGNGTQTLSGGNTYTGETRILGGRLNINGSVASDITVMGGVLGGNGTISGFVANTSGSVSPGNSIDTLTIMGDFSQGSGGTLEIEFNDTGQTDFLDITGTATLAGVVDYQPEPGAYLSLQTSTFLDAAGGVSGQFDSPLPAEQVQFGGLAVGLQYIGNTVELTITPALYQDFISGGVPGVVAEYMDSLRASATGDLAIVINNLNVLDRENLTAALPHLTAEPFYAIADVEVLENNNYQSVLRTRLTGPRMAYGHNFMSMNLDRSDTDTSPSTNSDSSPNDQQKVSSYNQSPDGKVLWVKWSGQYYDQDSDDEHSGYSSPIGNAIVGIDKTSNSGFTMGTSAGFSGGNIDFDNGRGDSELLGFRGDLYGGYRTPHFYMNGSVGGGYRQYDTTRNISFQGVSRTAETDFSGAFASVGLATGLEYEWNQLVIQPESGFNYFFFHQEQFSESGASSLNLTAEARDIHVVELEPGIRISKIMKIPNGLMRPSIFLGARHTSIVTGEDWIQGLTADGTFNLTGVNEDSTSGVAEVDAIFQYTDRITGSLNYHVSVRDHFQGHSLGFTTRWRW